MRKMPTKKEIEGMASAKPLYRHLITVTKASDQTTCYFNIYNHSAEEINSFDKFVTACGYNGTDGLTVPANGTTQIGQSTEPVCSFYIHKEYAPDESEYTSIFAETGFGSYNEINATNITFVNDTIAEV